MSGDHAFTDWIDLKVQRHWYKLRNELDGEIQSATDELRHFGQEIFLMADTKSGLTSNDYKLALERNRRLARTEGIDAVMKRFNLDALVAPTGGPAWLTDLVNGDSSMSPSPSTIAAVAGYPHVTVPMGSYRGLPIGLSFFGDGKKLATLLRQRPWA